MWNGLSWAVLLVSPELTLAVVTSEDSEGMVIQDGLHPMALQLRWLEYPVPLSPHGLSREIVGHLCMMAQGSKRVKMKASGPLKAWS